MSRFSSAVTATIGAFSIALSVGVLGPVSAAQAQTYRFITIDEPYVGTGEFGSMYIEGINDAGLVFGNYSDSINHLHGFLYNITTGVFTTVDGPNGVNGVYNIAINNHGDMVSWYPATNNASVGFLRNIDSSQYLSLNDPLASTLPYDGTDPLAINDNGYVAGIYSDASRVSHGFLYDGAKNTFKTLDVPNAPTGYGLGTEVTALNNSEYVVGNYTDSNLGRQGFIYNNTTGTFTTISDQKAVDEDGTGIYPSAINKNNLVIGSYYAPYLLIHGFLYDAATASIKDIDDPKASLTASQGTHPVAINDDGAVTGYYQDANGTEHGFLYNTATGTFTTVDDANGGTGYYAGTRPTSINNNGYIVGIYHNNAIPAHGFLAIPVAAITAFTPASGPVGTSVTISGTSFFGTSAVAFNGTPAKTFKLVSASSITATVPPGATTGPISVTTPGGTVSSKSSYRVTPVISGFTPTAEAPGATVTISGTSFTGATAVLFDGAPATAYKVITDKEITATVPAGATTGKISVVTPGGTAISSAEFAVKSAIVGFSPTSGPVGTHVTISGSSLAGTTAVKFNGTAATSVQVHSGASVTAAVPAEATSGRISLTTPSGTTVSSGNFLVTPTITKFAATSGPVGTVVTITGTTLAGATGVKFNGVAATAVHVVSSTMVTATVPAGATTGKISVSTPSGTATSGGSFTVTPSILRFSPASGRVGSVVTISGTSFTGATAVRFSTTTAVFKETSSTSITATVPSGAATGRISVATPGGTATSVGSFTVIPTVTVAKFAPVSGSVGASVTITGKGFVGATSVRFGATTATFTVHSASVIVATVPKSAKTGTVSVTAPGGTATSASVFTVK